MKKLVLFLFLSLAILANGKDCFTVVSVKIDGLPMALGQFSVYCVGEYLGNCEQSLAKKENSFAKNDLLIGITSENNKIVIQRADKSWDEFYINLDGIAMDGKHHKIKGSRLFTPRRAYEYEIEIVAEPIKAFTIEYFNIPAEYVKKHCSDFSSFVDPVFFVDICSGKKEDEKIIARTKNQDVTGNKCYFHLSNKVYCLSETFPIIIYAYVGEKKAVTKTLNTATGGGVGAIIGGIIGGVGAGVCTGGLGAPAGAAVGAAIGAFIGGGSAYFIAPVKGAKDIVSFRFENFDELKTQVKPIVNDILSDGQEIKLVVSKEDIK